MLDLTWWLQSLSLFIYLSIHTLNLTHLKLLCRLLFKTLETWKSGIQNNQKWFFFQPSIYMQNRGLSSFDYFSYQLCRIRCNRWGPLGYLIVLSPQKATREQDENDLFFQLRFSWVTGIIHPSPLFCSLPKLNKCKAYMWLSRKSRSTTYHGHSMSQIVPEMSTSYHMETLGLGI